MENDIFKKFTPNLKKAIISSQKIAAEEKACLDTEHQLMSLMQNKATLAFEILESFEIGLDRVNLNAHMLNPAAPCEEDKLITKDAKRCIQLAVHFASKFGHVNIGSEHLLLALISNKSFHSYMAIEHTGVDPKKIKKQIETIFKGINSSTEAMANQPNVQNMLQDDGFDDVNISGPGQAQPFTSTQNNQKKESTLDSFSTNLTKLASQGKLDPVIGRENEIHRLIQTLSRRTKNNPILVGEPGVGKTAIVEGLAQQIAVGNVPATLLGTQILSLDLGSVLAGTMYRGQFESRIKKILSEIEKKGNIILFVDEIHTMIGAGSTEGSIDAANLLKPMLSKGTLRMIGSTTFDEFKKHIEKDPAFERRFQSIRVFEPDSAETLQILEGLKPHYEKFHNVSYEKSALEAAVSLSIRYIHDRSLPDKAIDLIDEAGAAANATIVTTKNQLFKQQKELSELRNKKELAITKEKYEEAATLREKMMALEEAIAKHKAENFVPAKIITEEEIAGLVSDWTGIPVTNMTTKDKKNYLNLEKKLKSKIIGQDEPVDELAKAIKRSRVGIGNPKRPIGSFMFLGPTGVGKTELAKVLSREIFGSENFLIKIDMSEFMEKHNLARLIGAPAGYIGYEEGGRLTEKVRKNPYSVILFDEIEKAHPEIFNILLQIMEDGVLTDAKGRIIDFKNTIIIMTSNLGTDMLRKQISIGFNNVHTDKEKYEKLHDSVIETVEKTFRPEFINRLDKVVVFYPLDDKSLRKIVDLQCADFEARLLLQKIRLRISDPVKNMIAKESYNPEYGARPIRKYIQDHIENLISDAFLSDKIVADKPISLVLKDNKIVIE